MSVEAQPMVSKTSIVKPPQYVREGDGAANYAQTITDPVMIAPLNLSKLTDNLDNQFLDSKFGGTLDNQGKIKVRENNQITVSGRFLPTNECRELVEWCGNIDAGKKASGRIGGNSNNMTMTAAKGGAAGNSIRFVIQYSGTAGAIAISGNTITYSATSSGRTLTQIKNDVTAHAGASALVAIGAITGDNTSKPQAGTISLSGGTTGGKDGPRESRTWISSYLDNQDREVFRIARGCKPISCNVVLSKEDTLMLEITMKCRYYYETIAPTTDTGISGTPVYAIAEPTQDGLIFDDFGKFEYKPVLKSDKSAHDTTSLIYRSGNVQVDWALRVQDSNGDIRDVYFDYGGRTVSGQFSLFKEGHELNEDARKADQYVGWINLMRIPGLSGADVMAKDVPSGANAVELYSKLPGAAGNDITFEILAASTVSNDLQVRVSQHDIQVVPKKGGSTIAEIVAAINGDKLANNLVTAVAKGAGNLASVASVTLAGGVSKWYRIILERMKWQPSSEPLLEDEAATMEDKSLMADAYTARTT